MTDARFGRAMRWSFVMNGGVQVGNALTTLVLASELGPETFGLVALANFFVLLQEVLVAPGFASALIQRKDLRDRHLDSAFWLVCGMSLLLLSTCVAAAELWASYNDEPALVPLIRALSLSLPLRGLALVQQAVLIRAMDFKALAIRSNVAIAAGAVVGISMAFSGYGAWSIVGQQLSTSLVNLLVIWKLSPWRPNFAFQLEALRELLGFSFGVFLDRIGNFFSMHAETAVMGYWFGNQAVGLYRFSFRLVHMGVETGTRAVNMASLPAFSRQQSNPEGLRRATLQGIHSATLATFALLGLLAANIDFFLPVLKTQWTEASVPLRLLAVAGATQVIGMIVTPVLQSIGRPYSVAGLAWVWGLLTILVATGIGWWKQDASAVEQITTLAAGRALVAVVLQIPVYLGILRSLCRIGVQDLVPLIFPSLTAAAAAIAVAHGTAVMGWLEPLPAFISFMTISVVDGLIFVAVLAALDGEARRLIRGAFRRVFG